MTESFVRVVPFDGGTLTIWADGGVLLSPPRGADTLFEPGSQIPSRIRTIVAVALGRRGFDERVHVHNQDPAVAFAFEALSRAGSLVADDIEEFRNDNRDAIETADRNAPNPGTADLAMAGFTGFVDLAAEGVESMARLPEAAAELNLAINRLGAFAAGLAGLLPRVVSYYRELSPLERAQLAGNVLTRISELIRNRAQILRSLEQVNRQLLGHLAELPFRQTREDLALAEAYGEGGQQRMQAFHYGRVAASLLQTIAALATILRTITRLIPSGSRLARMLEDAAPTSELNQIARSVERHLNRGRANPPRRRPNAAVERATSPQPTALDRGVFPERSSDTPAGQRATGRSVDRDPVAPDSTRDRVTISPLSVNIPDNLLDDLPRTSRGNFRLGPFRNRMMRLLRGLQLRQRIPGRHATERQLASMIETLRRSAKRNPSQFSDILRRTINDMSRNRKIAQSPDNFAELFKMNGGIVNNAFGTSGRASQMAERAILDSLLNDSAIREIHLIRQGNQIRTPDFVARVQSNNTLSYLKVEVNSLLNPGSSSRAIANNIRSRVSDKSSHGQLTSNIRGLELSRSGWICIRVPPGTSLSGHPSYSNFQDLAQALFTEFSAINNRVGGIRIYAGNRLVAFGH